MTKSHENIRILGMKTIKFFAHRLTDNPSDDRIVLYPDEDAYKLWDNLRNERNIRINGLLVPIEIPITISEDGTIKLTDIVTIDL